jgi:hypothetical protein
VAGRKSHVSEYAICHVGDDSIAKRTATIEVARQHGLDLGASDAGRDEEIEQLREPELAPVLLVEREQPRAVSAQSSQPSGSIVT